MSAKLTNTEGVSKFMHELTPHPAYHIAIDA